MLPSRYFFFFLESYISLSLHNYHPLNYYVTDYIFMLLCQISMTNSIYIISLVVVAVAVKAGLRLKNL